MKYIAKVLAIVSVSVWCTTVMASPLPWHQWVSQLRVQALSEGIKPEVFDRIFSKIKAPSRKVLTYDRTQPEKRITFLKYRNTRADNYRVIMGRRQLAKHKALLNKISHYYGVSPCFIVSLWGLETSYGSFMGKFPVIQSLATLAYDARRGQFFRKQLLYALRIVNDGHVKEEDFKGEWAGASGHPQFLPSSWYHYAVDYNGDGKKDIWNYLPDALASIANYLNKNGWMSNAPWAIPVVVPSRMQSVVNQKESHSLAQWRQEGVTTIDGQPWPRNLNLKARIIQPYGGPHLMVFKNFDVIMKWNRSNYYAGTVGYLAEKICGRPLM